RVALAATRKKKKKPRRLSGGPVGDHLRTDGGNAMIGSKLLSATVAAAAILALSHGAEAQTKEDVFALVSQNTNNPFFDQARDGCKKAERELNSAIECRYVGPGEHGGGEEQVQVVNDLIAKKV